MSTKIIRLTTENVKRLSAVEITPDPNGNLIVIGGLNGQGKSSVLDSIMYALGGADVIPTKPVRRGEEKAVVELDLGDLIVKRTFNVSGGTQLVVTNKEGVKQSSPQTILDNLVGKLSFDPLAFAAQNPKEQSETLRNLLGLDFSAKETERRQLFDERTVINREANTLEARISSLKETVGLPDEEQSIGAVLDEQKTAMDKNAVNEKIRQAAKASRGSVLLAEESIQRQKSIIENTREQIALLQKNLAQQESQLVAVEQLKVERETLAKSREETASKLQDIDLGPFKEKFQQVEQTNVLIRQNKQRASVIAEFQEKHKKADALTAKIETIDKTKRDAITSAKYPVAGLGMSETAEVLFNGLPFEQASTSEQLRVSIAIGLALNPKLKVLLIRRGSDLDDQSLKLVADMATEANAQVWLERVGEQGQVSVIIEDGHVKEQ